MRIRMAALLGFPVQGIVGLGFCVLGLGLGGLEFRVQGLVGG